MLKIDRGLIPFPTFVEVLVLFSFIIKFRERDSIMQHTLFLLDGPLLLRAQLSRLVEPIRELIKDQVNQGRTIYIAGVEKTGASKVFWEIILWEFKSILKIITVFYNNMII